MGTREVTPIEIAEAQIAGWSNRLAGAEHLIVRELGDGRAVYLRDLLFGAHMIGIGLVGDNAYLDQWDYTAELTAAAWRAALAWDGAGEPEGWYRHARTGRRRPGGDPSREHGSDEEPPEPPQQQPEQQQPAALAFGPNLFVLKRVPNDLEREALMRFETWSRLERLGWRIRYGWWRFRNWCELLRARFEV